MLSINDRVVTEPEMSLKKGQTHKASQQNLSMLLLDVVELPGV